MSNVKKGFEAVFYFLVVSVLCLKIANWFLHFDEAANSMISNVMFILIGLFYLPMAWSSKQFWRKALFSACAILLIVCSLIEKTSVINILMITAILTVVSITKLLPEKVKARVT